MKFSSYCCLLLSLIAFTACTTLTGAEQCALIGQVQVGTQIGTQTHVSSVGGSVYSYNTPSYNPVCKLPKTEEEKTTVTELLPVAQEKRKQRTTEQWAWVGGSLILLILLSVANTI